MHELPDGDVLIRVEYSSLNYKDALAATGHAGVARKFPHVPGIDAAGTVVESRSPEFKPGDSVLVTGCDLGAGRWGGWAEFIRVPAEWVIPSPAGMSHVELVRYGTAGFTAALSVTHLLHHEVLPASGEIVVTGATGGVGSIAVQLLAKLGYDVAAVTGKADRHDWLRALGAKTII
jgi:putative YhdH/YhfP family quinone oxidoreductase